MTDAMAGLQTMINKQFNVFDPVVVNIGWLKAGDDHTTNVIPEQSSFGATIRTFSPGMLDNLKKHVTTYLENTAAAFGVSVDIDWGQYATEVVMNDPAATERVRKVVREAFGEQAWMEWPHPIAGAEDFGSIVREIPGAFIFLGAAPADTDWQNAAPNHSNRAVFDDSVVPSGCALLAGLAFDVLNEAASKA
jgi:hippurate hydrolase